MEVFLITAGVIASIFGLSFFSLRRLAKGIDRVENVHRSDLLGKSIVYFFAFAFFSMLIIYGVGSYNSGKEIEDPAVSANDLIGIGLSYNIISIRKDDIQLNVRAILTDKKATLSGESYVLKFVWKDSKNIKKSQSISVTDGSSLVNAAITVPRDNYQLYAVLYWRNNTIPSTAIPLSLKDL